MSTQEERDGQTLSAGQATPGEGEIAAEEVAQARRDIEASLKEGSADLHTLFAQSDEEEGSSHRVIGHMHIKAALLAMPHIGEKKADEVLTEAGLEADRHIDTIGRNERMLLMNAVRERQPEGEELNN